MSIRSFIELTRGLYYKTFMALILQYHHKLECLPLSVTSSQDFYLHARLGAYHERELFYTTESRGLYYKTFLWPQNAIS